MKYYLLEDKVDESVTSFPVLEFNFEKNERFFMGKDNGYNFPFLSKGEFYDNKIPIPSYKLVKNAQLFDNLSGSVLAKGRGLFVSGKLKSIIESLKTPEVKFFPLDLVDSSSNDVTDYYFMQMIQPASNTDYVESTFGVYRILTKEYDFKLKSDNDYIEQAKLLLKDRKKVKVESISLSPEFANQQFDIFFNLHFPSNFILSQKAKDLLLQDKVTGIEIKETTKIKAGNTM